MKSRNAELIERIDEMLFAPAPQDEREARDADFGDYVLVEQRRFGVPNEWFVHKVVTRIESNCWLDVPAQSFLDPVIHDHSEPVLLVICCGVSEDKVIRYRAADCKLHSRSARAAPAAVSPMTEAQAEELILNCVRPSAVSSPDEAQRLTALLARLRNKCADIADDHTSTKLAAEVIRSIELDAAVREHLAGVASVSPAQSQTRNNAVGNDRANPSPPHHRKVSMRQIDDFKINPANDTLTVTATDAPGAGGANHRYEVRGFDASTNASHDPNSDAAAVILFQNGPIAEHGVNGVTQEGLLSVVADRLRSFQAGPFACRENALALTKIEEAQHWLQQRTLARMRRGVEGTTKL